MTGLDIAAGPDTQVVGSYIASVPTPFARSDAAELYARRGGRYGRVSGGCTMPG